MTASPGIDTADAIVDLLQADPAEEEARRRHTTVDELRSTLHQSVRILRLLRGRESLYRSSYVPQEQRRAVRETLTATVGTAYRSYDLARDEPDYDQIRETLRAAAGTGTRCPPIILARLFAECLERRFALQFWEQLRRYYGVNEPTGPDVAVETAPLTADDPVPVCLSIFAGQEKDKVDKGTSPRNLPRWRAPDRLASYVLAPPGVGAFRLVLNFDLFNELGPLHLQTPQVALVLPTEHGDEYHYERDLDSGTLTGVRPRRPEDPVPSGARPAAVPDGQEYQGRLHDGIDIATEAKAVVVALPELSVPSDHLDPLVEHWRSRQPDDPDAKAGGFLVAGSYHHRTGRSTRNLATVVGRRSRHEVEKIVPFVLREKVPPSPEGAESALDPSADPVAGDDASIELIEDIEQADYPSIRIFCGKHVTFSAVICADLLMDAVRDLMRDLDVSLVVVPSMSTKTRVFDGLVAGHVAGTQGGVFVPNAVTSSDQHVRALVGLPRPPYMVRVTGDDGGGGDIPSADVVVDPSGDQDLPVPAPPSSAPADEPRVPELGRVAASGGPGVVLVPVQRPSETRWLPIAPAGQGTT